MSDDTSLKKMDKMIDTLPTKDNLQEIKNAITEAVEETGNANTVSESIPKEIQTVKTSFCTASEDWEKSKLLKNTVVHFSFQPSKVEEEKWRIKGIQRLSSLLRFLEGKFHGLESFDLIFFRGNFNESFYYKSVVDKTIVYVNLDTHQEYTNEISSAIRDLKVSKYYWSVRTEFSKKVLRSFFNKKSSASLITELQNSYHGVIEEILNEYENLPEGKQKKDMTTIFMQSKLARDSIKEYSKLKPKSAAKILSQLIPVLSDLTPKEIEILLKDILKSESSREFIKQLSKLPKEQRDKIAKNFPESSIMFNRYEKLSTSLKQFKALIAEHKKAKTKNEKRIHQFLIKHYWLLGIEYFDKELLSDTTTEGKKTTDTKLPNGRCPDFIINRLDRFDKCVVIEIEEANDGIFTESGNLAKAVYDGIFQAADYNIEQKFNSHYSKSIAIVGSVDGTDLSLKQKKHFQLLDEEFPNIDIITYDHIIGKAQTTLDFWKKYNVKNLFIENNHELED